MREERKKGRKTSARCSVEERRLLDVGARLLHGVGASSQDEREAGSRKSTVASLAESTGK